MLWLWLWLWMQMFNGGRWAMACPIACEAIVDGFDSLRSPHRNFQSWIEILVANDHSQASHEWHANRHRSERWLAPFCDPPLASASSFIARIEERGIFASRPPVLMAWRQGRGRCWPTVSADQSWAISFA